MSDKIKPSEVSEVLQQQLQEVNGSQQFDEVGTVLTVSDGVARIYGLRNAEANELLEFENGTMAIVMNLEEDNVGCVLLGPTAGIKEGQSVKRTHRIASIRVNDNFLGRVVNPLGQAIDGLGDIDLTDSFEMPLDRKAPGVIYRQPVKEPLQTGLKAVDSMIPIGRGQRELIIGDRQTGKTAIAVDTIINQKSFYEAGKPVYCIYVAIGQKESTVARLVQKLKEHDAMKYTVVVNASASSTAPLQYIAPYAGCAMGEEWMEQGKDVYILSTDMDTGATPSAFYAHVNSRYNHEKILEYKKQASEKMYISLNETSINSAVAELLEKLKNSSTSYFVMIEEAYIDKCSHNNDYKCMEQALKNFDEAVRLVYEFAGNRDDVHVFVTADHETGGLSQNCEYTTGNHTLLDVSLFAKTNSFFYKNEMENNELYDLMKEVFR